MVSDETAPRWMGPIQYPNDPKQIRITFILLPIAAALFAFLMWKSAGAWM